MTSQYQPGMTPYTDAERERDAADRLLRKPDLAPIRKRAAPHGRYDLAPSPQTKARDLRILGESQ